MSKDPKLEQVSDDVQFGTDTQGDPGTAAPHVQTQQDGSAPDSEAAQGSLRLLRIGSPGLNFFPSGAWLNTNGSEGWANILDFGGFTSASSNETDYQPVVMVAHKRHRPVLDIGKIDDVATWFNDEAFNVLTNNVHVVPGRRYRVRYSGLLVAGAVETATLSVQTAIILGDKGIIHGATEATLESEAVGTPSQSFSMEWLFDAQVAEKLAIAVRAGHIQLTDVDLTQQTLTVEDVGSTHTVPQEVGDAPWTPGDLPPPQLDQRRVAMELSWLAYQPEGTIASGANQPIHFAAFSADLGSYTMVDYYDQALPQGASSTVTNIAFIAKHGSDPLVFVAVRGTSSDGTSGPTSIYEILKQALAEDTKVFNPVPPPASWGTTPQGSITSEATIEGVDHVTSMQGNHDTTILKDQVKALVAASPMQMTVVCTGHSLGGSLTFAMPMLLEKWLENTTSQDGKHAIVKFTNFAGATPGNKILSDYIAANYEWIPGHSRTWNSWDLVPTLWEQARMLYADANFYAKYDQGTAGDADSLNLTKDLAHKLDQHGCTYVHVGDDPALPKFPPLPPWKKSHLHPFKPHAPSWESCVLSQHSHRSYVIAVGGPDPGDDIKP